MLLVWQSFLEPPLPHAPDPLASPRSSPGCTLPSSCPLAPGRWWWWEPQRCWQRRKGRPQSRPRKRWTSPSGCCGSGLGLPLSHRPSAARLWGQKEEAGMVEAVLAAALTQGFISWYAPYYIYILLKIFFFFFGCGPFLKSSLNSRQYCFCFMFWFFGHYTCGFLIPQWGTEPTHAALEGKLLTNGLPGKPPEVSYLTL